MSAVAGQAAAKVEAGIRALPPRQFAALPWRVGRKGRFEVLLVTSRRRGRWILPKGWPAPGCSAARSAAREAFEEAGVIGRPGDEPLGSYSHSYVREDGSVGLREVAVHGLQVQGTLVDWPEKGQRKRAWWPVEEAASLVGEPGLAELLRSLRPDRESLPDFLRRDPRTGELPASASEPAIAVSQAAGARGSGEAGRVPHPGGGFPGQEPDGPA
jgi:8-oxo-dGTP pyrophosphatase MutT (NUDIX family)